MSKKVILLLLILATLIGGFSLYSFSVIAQNNTKKPVEIQKVVYQDPILLEKLKSIGAKYTDNLSLEYVDDINSVLPTTQQYSDTIIGLYNQYNHVLYIESSVESATEIKVIAHEYLHYIWYNYMSKSEQDSLIELSRTIVLQDNYLSYRVQERITNGTYTDRELFPMVCTELSDQNIVTMLETCNKYIDRSKLTF